MINKFYKTLVILTFSVCAIGATQAQPTLFQNGMIQYVADIDQYSYSPSDGSRFGIKETPGKIILPTQYANIQYFGHGIFLATDVESKHKYYFGEKRRFFNRAGVELNYKLPANAVLLTVFTFGAAAENNFEQELSELPKDTILVAAFSDGKQTLCDLEGNMLLKPHLGKILFLSPTLAFLVGGARCKTVDMTTGTVSATSDQYNPRSYPPPRLQQGVDFKLPKDLTITSDKNDDGLFDTVYWRDRRTYPISSLCMFNRFLRDHDLIGMTRRDVEKWLGTSTKSLGLVSGADPSARNRLQTFMQEPDSIVYRFRNEGCIPFFSGIRISLKEDKVINWRFLEESKESEPITKNVLLKVGYGAPHLGWAGARIGQSPGYGEDGFPLVELKPLNAQTN